MADFGTVMGQEGMKWWIGTVEDRGTGQFSGVKDELKLGRIKVRIKGHHTEDRGKLPTKELPWCYVLMPCTSAGISGVGRSPTGVVENAKVIGFFLDGDAGQYPIVFGVLPHIQQKQEAKDTAPGSGAKTTSAPAGKKAAGAAGSAPNGAPGPNASIDEKLAYANQRLAQSETTKLGPQKGSSEILTYNGQQYKITY